MNLSVFFSNTYVQIGIILLVFLIVVGVFYYKKRSTSLTNGPTSGSGTTSTTASGPTSGSGTTSTTASGPTRQGTTSTTSSGSTQGTLNPLIYNTMSNMWTTNNTSIYAKNITVLNNGFIQRKFTTQEVIKGLIKVGNNPNIFSANYGKGIIYTYSYNPITNSLLEIETGLLFTKYTVGTLSPLLFPTTDPQRIAAQTTLAPVLLSSIPSPGVDLNSSIYNKGRYYMGITLSINTDFVYKSSLLVTGVVRKGNNSNNFYVDYNGVIYSYTYNPNTDSLLENQTGLLFTP
jgi:hypothetical protein